MCKQQWLGAPRLGCWHRGLGSGRFCVKCICRDKESQALGLGSVWDRCERAWDGFLIPAPGGLSRCHSAQGSAGAAKSSAKLLLLTLLQLPGGKP